MGWFSAIGTAVGSLIGGPVGSKIGAAAGSLIDGKMSSGGSSRAGQLDLGRLRRQAEKHGFNPLTVLRNTGGAGFQRGPEAPSFFAESARHFGNALDQIHADERQTAEVENLEALTGVYRSEIALNNSASQVAARTVPVFSGGGGPSSGWAARPHTSSAAQTATISPRAAAGGATATLAGSGLTYSMDPPASDYDLCGVNLYERYAVHDQTIDVPVGPDLDEMVSGTLIGIGSEIKQAATDPYGALQDLGRRAVRDVVGIGNFVGAVAAPIADAMGVMPTITPTPSATAPSFGLPSASYRPQSYGVRGYP